MKIVLWILVVLICASSQTIFAQHQINGQIVDGENLPVIGEVIQLLPTDKQTVTDDQGEFTFSNISTGEYSISIDTEWWQVNKKITVNNSIDNLIIRSKLILPVEEIIIKSVRFNQEKNPSQTTFSKSEIVNETGAADLPYVLQSTPSLVVTSDAGAGVGYTSMRIRGTDQTRINVTINGIPLNDAESQNVFFVDLPDLASSANSIQIQRGVGTSSHGAASFGASVNVNTHEFSKDANVTLTGLIGSFNTQKASVQFNTGKISNGFYLSGRLSQITSDGYIDRATSDLKSFALSPTYIFNNSSLRYDLLYGKERTYQSWYGVTQDVLETDRTFNEAGTERAFAPHPDQVDDYQQVHHQLHFNSALSDRVSLGVSAHYTPGNGFFEEYKADQSRLDYGFPALLVGTDTIIETDLIRRRWLDNHFYGVVGSMELNTKNNNTWIVGGGWNHYQGRHFGEVVWAEFAQDVHVENKYYDNEADKYDGNIYVKYNHQFSDKFSSYVDLQYRNIVYKFNGPDQNREFIDQTDNLNFFNPKLGLALQLNNNTNIFFQTGIAQKEPNRDDYTESSPLSRPRHEWLWDTELGAAFTYEKFTFKPNFYYMKYRDQLALNGAINDVGAATRVNVDDSYRLGIELDLAWRASPKLTISGNATFSKNEVVQFDQFVDNYDADFNYIDQQLIQLNNTPLTFSPNSIGFARVDYKLFAGDVFDLNIFANAKHVGEQYVDLSGDENNILDSYQTIDAGIQLDLKGIVGKHLSLRLNANNITEEFYSANGWSYKYILDGEVTYLRGFYPQALRHCNLQATIKF